MASPLVELANIITKSIGIIDSRCKFISKPFPGLNQSFDPSSEAVRLDAEVAHAISLVVSAAAQLIAAVRPPTVTLLDTASGFFLSAALGTASSSGVAEILREAGSEGCHVKDIARVSKISSAKLGRLLRALATHHIFREVSPDVFAHNRISSLLDTGKSSQALLERPDEKYQNALGFSSLVECFTDEVFKGAAYLTETILDKNTTQSGEPTDTSLNRAFHMSSNLFEWYEQPENSLRFKRFSSAMDGARRVSPPEAVLQGFDWSSLPPDSQILDVGGGIGSTSLVIAKNYPMLRMVIQDRPPVVRRGEEHWTSQFPGALATGQVKFQTHDFFTPQPFENQRSTVFLLRFILHDWSDSYCSTILRHIRAVANPDSKLVIIDYIVPYACHIPGDSPEHAIPGASELNLALESGPLLPNLGLVSSRPYLADLQLMTVLNGQERTLGQFIELFAATGWKASRVYRIPNSPQQQLVAIPV